MHMFVSVYVCMHIASTYAHVCQYVRMYAYRLHICTCLSVCTYVCMYIVTEWTFIHTYKEACLYTYTQEEYMHVTRSFLGCAHVHVFQYVCTHVWSHVGFMHRYCSAPSHICAYVHVCALVYMYVNVFFAQACVYKGVYVQTHILYTYTCTHVYNERTLALGRVAPSVRGSAGGVLA
jgi:hypothetical protein